MLLGLLKRCLGASFWEILSQKLFAYLLNDFVSSVKVEQFIFIKIMYAKLHLAYNEKIQTEWLSGENSSF